MESVPETGSAGNTNVELQNLREKLRDLEFKYAELLAVNEQQKDLSILFNISLQLLESVDKNTVLKKIVESAAHLFGTDTSAIYLIKGEDLLLKATYPPLPENFPEEFLLAKLVNHPHIQKVIVSETEVIVADTSKVVLSNEEALIVQRRNLGSIVYIPLFVNHKIAGVIIWGTMERCRNFEKHEINLFRTFSNITSLALENVFLVRNLIETKEKAEENDRLKTAFLHNVSHEIRTPLNAIMGFSGMLNQKAISKELISKYTDIIDKSGKQLLSIVDDILSISHIETRRITIHESPVSLNVMLDNIELQYKDSVLSKGVEFRVINSIVDRDLMIYTDEFKLIGILTNIINNAVKFTNQGSIEIGCLDHKSYVEFYVKDTGIGISETEQKKIFERFYQADHNSNRNYGGMGLGLSISAAYAEILGGKITIESKSGQGSRFNVIIPKQGIRQSSEKIKIYKQDH